MCGTPLAPKKALEKNRLENLNKGLREGAGQATRLCVILYQTSWVRCVRDMAGIRPAAGEGIINV